jgi:galactose mutarotase-like enzyme
MKYTIANEKISVTVNSDGAELISVVKDGKEWIWQNPTGEWAGHAPLLFPVCGHFGLTHEGVEYPLPSHGFAKRKAYTVASKTDTRLEFVLCADESTKEVYPFDFCFHVIYAIEDSKLSIEYVVENVGEKPLYFACGGHESFNLDANVDSYVLTFDKEENFVAIVGENTTDTLAGEHIRRERPTAEEILEVKKLVERKLGKPKNGNIIYHLDKTQLKNYTNDEINQILSL